MDMVGDEDRIDPLDGDSSSQGQNSINIVHVSSLAQNQSVIQAANQQSVIQGPGQLGKGNLILVGKSNSVIQATGGQTLQVVGEHEGDFYEDDATRKRREILARRPSYRKILNDLAGEEDKGSMQNEDDDGESPVINLASIAPSSRGNITAISGTQYASSSGLLKVIPASAIHIGGQSNGIHAISMSSGNDNQPTLVQYTQAQDGSQQFFVPVGVNGDLQTYTLRPVTTTSSLNQSIMMASPCSPEDRKRPLSTDSKGRSGGEGDWDVPEPLIQKRELRLLKNREAARECRRKKKEYIKCLENRVAVLENQNKALIEELKSLKELYCSQKDEMH